MKEMRSARIALSVLLVMSWVPFGARAEATRPTDEVDPFIGTMGAGFVFPGPAMPYGMVQLSPDTEGQFAYTGYQYIDRFIRGFSHVHTQSMGVPEGGELPFMPTTGEVVTEVKSYQSLFDHAFEEAEPGYYAVDLLSYGIKAELTAGLRVGMHRYTFPPTDEANVLLDIGRRIPGGPTDDIQTTPGQVPARGTIVDDRTITGTVDPPAGTKDYTVHFAARFDRPFTSSGVWTARGEPLQEGGTNVDGVGAGAAVRFDTTSDPDVVVKVGISYVSVDNALDNLADELPGEDFDFDALRERTRAAWDDALSVIDIDGGTAAERAAFMTALYHAQHHPNVFTDANGEYRGYDDEVHTIGAPDDPMPAGSTYYANFSMWDTYRAEMPLLMLIAPDRVRDMMRSLAAIVEQGGRFPRWGWMNRYADFMNGEPALQVFGDAYCRGLVPADALDTLYDEAVRLALVDRRNPEYLTTGWTNDTSATLEHALGDFAVALVADARGAIDDRDALLGDIPSIPERWHGAASWRNVFDPETRFMRPREQDGTWYEPFLPESPERWREGTGWQYLWLVPQDVGGLFGAIGREEALLRLDRFFSLALTGSPVWAEVQQKLTLYGIAYAGDQYAPSNEHDLQAPWLYNWIGHPERTQAIQRAYQGLYRATPDGLPGNDDLGTMSAWFIWSALGMYPVTPGSPTYTVGSPLFERATIALPDGDTVTIRAPGASTAVRHIEGAALDGDPFERLWITHDELTGADELSFVMSPRPSSWGSAPEAAPPSQSTSSLSDFACAP